MQDMHSAKRMKLADKPNDYQLSTAMPIRAILPDHLMKLPKTEPVLVGTIRDNKMILKAMIEIGKCLPIKQMQFVKRVKNSEILLCSLARLKEIAMEVDLSLSGDEKIGQLAFKVLIQQGLDEELARILSEDVKTVEIPEEVPVMKWQFQEFQRTWPLKFHENKYLEALWSGKMFKDSEVREHLKNMEICDLIAEEFKLKNVGLAVNPYTKSIVAIGYPKTSENPILHCPMILIDAVALTQDGGVWMSKTAVNLKYTKALSLQSIQNNLTQYIYGSVTLAFVAAIIIGLLFFILLRLFKKVIHVRNKIATDG